MQEKLLKTPKLPKYKIGDVVGGKMAGQQMDSKNNLLIGEVVAIKYNVSKKDWYYILMGGEVAEKSIKKQFVIESDLKDFKRKEPKK